MAIAQARLRTIFSNLITAGLMRYAKMMAKRKRISVRRAANIKPIPKANSNAVKSTRVVRESMIVIQ